MRDDEFDSQLEAVSLLADPVRRSLYRHVADQSEAVSREEAARATGISRILAAFHLDRLVEAGLLDAIYRRLSGRTGPGAGRTSKLYRRARREIRLTLPERRYDLLAGVLAEALEPQREPATEERLVAAAKRVGARLASEARDRAKEAGGPRDGLRHGLEVLAETGFEPIQEGDQITLRNCPFDALAQGHRELVCGVNLSLMEGFVEGLNPSGLAAQLQPADGRCCVQLRVAGAPSAVVASA